MKREGSLAGFVWRYEPDPGKLARPQTVSTCPEAITLSNELKRLGWGFVGPTTVYAFMQAMGMVNDHMDGCFCRAEIEKARKTFKRPA